MSTGETTTIEIPTEDQLRDMTPEEREAAFNALLAAPADATAEETVTAPAGEQQPEQGALEQLAQQQEAAQVTQQQAEEIKPPRHVPVEEHAQERQRRKAAEQRARELEAENARLQGFQEAATKFAPQTKPEPQDPMPDPVLEPEQFAAWQDREFDRRVQREVGSLRQELEQREAVRQQREYQSETKRLLRDAKATPEAVLEAKAFIEEREPWMVAGLNSAPNPFKAALEYAQRLGYQLPTQPDSAQPQTTTQPAAGGKVYTEAEVQQLIAAKQRETIDALAKNGGQISRAPSITGVPAASASDPDLQLPSEDEMREWTPEQRRAFARKHGL